MFSLKAKAVGSKKRAERDIVALGIAVAAIIMFLGTGSSVMPQIARSWMFGAQAPDPILINALLLNIALVVFGLRRYRELIIEIEQRRAAEEIARELSEIDPLTGCLNRRSAAPATDKLIAKTDDEVAFMMIDLDNFKLINDLNGHKAGDHILQTTAKRIREGLPAGSVLARLGGDEFACVVNFKEASPDRIDQLAADIIERTSRPIDINSVPIEITISVGISSTMSIGEAEATNPDGDTLMHRADIAMYHAKKKGKNRYFWFENTMESELRFRNDIENGIRRGIADGAFVPYYEQQVDLDTGELVGFEMLARWNSPELGLVNPSVFIPVAEEIGLISPLSESLIAQAFADAKEWDPKLTLAVNISPIQLRDPWFSQKLLKLLVKENFPPERLEIEITESCLHENIGVVKSMITSLKNQGVKISLDDFGTGYSSLAQLRTLPFDRLKIDRSFVGELNAEEASNKIVNAIIALGDGLAMPVTAEGIEDERILDALRGKGQMKGQGYHYGRPEHAADVRKRLAKLGLLVDDPVSGKPIDNASSERQTKSA